MLCNSLLKYIGAARNEKGIALVTSLMLTLISLAIILTMMYLVSSSIQRTGVTKRYKTALQASYGGTEILVKDIVPYIMRNYSSATLNSDLVSTYANSSVGVSLALPSSTSAQCLQAKLMKSTANWPTACNNTLNPKNMPDLQLNLPGANSQPFTVYAKIVDTLTGNSDTSGLQLGGAGVAESQSVLAPQHFPYIYRLEVQAERSTNAVEKANISVLYAY